MNKFLQTAFPGRHQPHNQRDAHEFGVLAIALYIHRLHRGTQGAHADGLDMTVRGVAGITVSLTLPDDSNRSAVS